MNGLKWFLKEAVVRIIRRHLAKEEAISCLGKTYPGKEEDTSSLKEHLSSFQKKKNTCQRGKEDIYDSWRKPSFFE